MSDKITVIIEVHEKCAGGVLADVGEAIKNCGNIINTVSIRVEKA